MTPFLRAVIAQREAEQEAAILAMPAKAVRDPAQLRRTATRSAARSAEVRFEACTDCGVPRTTVLGTTGCCRMCLGKRRLRRRIDLGRRLLKAMNEGETLAGAARGFGISENLARTSIADARAAR